MPHDVRLYLEDMLEAVRRVRSYTAGLDEPSFRADSKTIDAVLRNLEILGEAAKCVPEDVRARAADVEWRKISGMRDFLVHVYFAVNLDIVWDVVTHKLPALEPSLVRLLREMPVD